MFFDRGLILFTHKKSLLPEKNVDRDALTRIFSNIKPRFTLSIVEGLRRLNHRTVNLSLMGLCFLLLFSLSPVISTPFTQTSIVYAQTARNLPIFDLPHDGYISTKFSSYHPGVDIATNLGSPIHPIASGIVESVLFGNEGYGNHVIIAHSDGYKSLYGHMAQIMVMKGQAVSSISIL